MPLDYASLLATATGTIEAMGRDAALRTLDGTSQTPVTVLMSNYGAREREGALMSRDDRRAIIAAKPGVPTPDPETHKLLLDGKSFRIVSVRPLDPGGTVLYWDCQVRL